MMLADTEPEVTLWLPAEDDSLPLGRQTLRVLGSVGGGDEAILEDAEIAVTEALSNALEHAYSGPGIVEMLLRIDGEALAISVIDHGRGLAAARTPSPKSGGFGLQLIESLAHEVSFGSPADGGSEVQMRFDGGYGAAHEISGPRRSEAVVRRVVAVLAAQADLAVDMLPPLLRTAGLAALCASEHIREDATNITFERLPGGLELTFHALERPGGEALVDLLHSDGLEGTNVSAALAPGEAFADLSIRLPAAI